MGMEGLDCVLEFKSESEEEKGGGGAGQWGDGREVVEGL